MEKGRGVLGKEISYNSNLCLQTPAQQQLHNSNTAFSDTPPAPVVKKRGLALIENHDVRFFYSTQ